MSRTIKRVPLDFDWPLDKTWEGYLAPSHLQFPACPDCRSGMTDSAEWLSALTTMILMLGEDQRTQQQERPLHPYLRALENVYTSRRPGPDALELSAGLAGRAPSLLGHDAIDQWTAVRKIVEAAGLDPKTWGTCPTCKGHATIATDAQRAEAEAWEDVEPPAGDGWQLWETVSKGSPVTPVFGTALELVDHLATIGDHPGKVRPMSRAAAAALVADGWAPSGVIIEHSVTVAGESISAGATVYTNGDALLALDGDPEASPYAPEDPR